MDGRRRLGGNYPCSARRSGVVETVEGSVGSRKVWPVVAGAGSVWVVIAAVVTAALLRPGLGSFPDFARGGGLDYGVGRRTYPRLSERFIENALSVRAPNAASLDRVSWAAGAPLSLHGPAKPNAIGPGHDKVTWQGREFREPMAAGPDGCASGQPSLCDRYTLRVDVSPAYWRTFDGGVRISIDFDLRVTPEGGLDSYNDFDLFVFRDGRRIASSVTRQGTSFEEVFLTEASGSYEILVVPELVSARGGRYTGTARFEAEPRGRVANQAYDGLRMPSAPKVEPQTRAAAYTGEPLSVRAVDFGNVNRPSIGVDPSGTAFLFGFAREGGTTPLPGEPRSHLLRSMDGGVTWTPTGDAVAQTWIAAHRVSPDHVVTVDSATGRVFRVDGALGYDSSIVSFSDDAGETFQSTVVTGQTSTAAYPSIVTAPVPHGFQLGTTDEAFDRLVYHCASDLLAVHFACSRSIDGGRSFVRTGVPPAIGWNAEKASECRTYVGDAKADADGRLFVPRNYCDRWDPRDDLRYVNSLLDSGKTDTSWGQNEIPMVSISEDGGTTWKHVVVSERIRSVHNARPQMAADAEGNLYFVWEDLRHHLPYMATSTDHGRTWSDPVMIAPPEVREASFTNIVAGDRGRVAFAFIGSTTADGKDLTRPWNLYVGLSENALAAAPVFVATTVNDAADPVHRGDCELDCSWKSYGLDIEVSPHDGDFWVAAMDTCTNVNRCRTHPAPGHTDADGPGVSSDDRGLAIRQLSGPRLFAG